MSKHYLTGAAVIGALFFMAGTASAAATCGLNNGKKATGEPIKVGAVIGQTGPDDFSSASKAAQAYFNCVNENGGINGRPINYLVKDDQWNPETAAQVATKLVKDEKVVALVGSASFVEMGVNAKLYEQEGVMSMASGCAVAECFESKNIVSTNEGPMPSSVGAAQWAVANLQSKHVTCIGLTIPTVGQYSCGWTEKYMTSKGLKGSSVLIDPSTADMNSAFLEAVANSPDTILVNLPAGMAAAFLSVALQSGQRDSFKWISSTPLYDRDVPALLGDAWSGVMYVNTELTPIDGTGPDANNWRAILDQYGAKSDPRDTFSQAGYLSARFFTDAILKLDPGKINRATVTDAIRAIKNEKSDLLCGPYYVGDGDRHMPNHANMMVQFVNGGYKVVGPCTDVDSAYLEPYRAQEKALGITN
ncbi:ABC transporter substrate-binding protein [Agrobacterium vitis]|uniref:ABC transporter substrate-binding protein n=1 Tax=Agrobacterium vitis TaxID=373 RepID=A0A109CLU6_AGRVI|nr:ABC transporter substrate-binding protein [Agrobacterium vitis]KAA3509812.1 branched-chain amino acid ABC transporter substrate-binding protein [Agrobacterium vitis]KAA3523434.1 branched-chain amino acid ABC transporter substrate-binding protein [Agrobacterium vitis]MCF1479036.1 ABC transporter substrate-binding protein [Agrobacterium vitis]MUO80303.1 ABC transporter substrate-binding protein [Agrobacterium vitis]MUO94897.1 ABC transporter substrate-binding protein [Agrobacterium vitis]